jgi:quinol monooxygenase YgiN
MAFFCRCELARGVARSLPSLALLLAVMAAVAPAQAQTAGDTIYGVTSLDVVPRASGEGATLLKQYRDAAQKQPGNLGVTLLQEIDWANRFLIYETWKDQAAFDANETAAHTAALRDKLKPIEGAPYDRRDHKIVSVGPAQQAGGEAVYLQVHLDVFPPGLDATLAAAKVMAEAARKGDGNLRYDVVGGVKAPTSHSTLFAAWRNRQAFDAYEMSPYARQFRATIGPLLGSPYDDRLYRSVN